MPGLSKETVVDIWLNSDDAIRVLEKGYKIIHAAVEYFYLVSISHQVAPRESEAYLKDCGHGNWIGADGGGPSWCDPSKAGRGYTRKSSSLTPLTPDSTHITISEKTKRSGC
jgi:hexosaminidase